MNYKEILTKVLGWLKIAVKVVKEVGQFLGGLVGLVEKQRDEESNKDS